MATTAETTIDPDAARPRAGWRTLRRIADADPETRRQWRLRIMFFIVVPLVLGFLLGWWRVGRAANAPLDASFAYWLVMALVTTWVNDLAARPVAAVARPRGVPLWLVLLVMQPIAGTLLIRPIADAYAGWLGSLLEVALVRPGSDTLIPSTLQYWPSNVVMWLGVNLLFFHGLGMTRFGYVPRNHAAASADASASASASTAHGRSPARSELAAVSASESESASTHVAARTAIPAFMERVRPERRGDLLALRAEGHYLRVYTSNGSDLVLYRMSDATAELDARDGAQVHRSWWVADRALATDRHADRLVLTNGIDVPVSRSYRLAARSRGWLA